MDCEFLVQTKVQGGLAGVVIYMVKSGPRLAEPKPICKFVGGMATDFLEEVTYGDLDEPANVAHGQFEDIGGLESLEFWLYKFFASRMEHESTAANMAGKIVEHVKEVAEFEP